MDEKKRADTKVSLDYLDTLSSKEAHLLITALDKKQQTILVTIDWAEVSSLVDKGLLRKVPTPAEGFDGYLKPVTVPTFV